MNSISKQEAEIALKLIREDYKRAVSMGQKESAKILLGIYKKIKAQLSVLSKRHKSP